MKTASHRRLNRSELALVSDPASILEASALDHSDTDNAERLRIYFDENLTVIA